jgi:NDP-sugar pyrophosphorylase family protein
MILAAGFGTRLGTLSDERPKPLLPVADVALIRYAVALLVGHGIRDIVVNLHHRGELIEAELGDGRTLGAHIVYSREPDLLGTGGGLRRALPLLGDGAVVVVNGKIIIDVDLGAVLAQHRAAGAAATLVVREDAEARRWGAIAAPAGGGPISGFFGEGDFMFTGVHVLETAALSLLPDDGQERCIVRQGYVPWIAAGSLVQAFVQRGTFLEHSTPARYIAGNVAVLRGAATVPFAPGPLAGTDPAAIVAASARVIEPALVAPGAFIGEGAVVGPDVVLGRGARIDAGVRIERAVVWPGATVAADVRDVIVTPRQVVSAAEPG